MQLQVVSVDNIPMYMISGNKKSVNKASCFFVYKTAKEAIPTSSELKNCKNVG